jgi:AAA+ superfamily predicted ATPase
MIDFSKPANEIIELINNVYHNLQESFLRDEEIKKNKKDIVQLCKFFKCNHQQAIILSVLIQLYYLDSPTSISEVIEHLNIPKSHANTINSLLNLFVEREWITPEKNIAFYPFTTYTINKVLINGIATMSLKSIPIKPINNCWDFFDAFKIILNQRKNRKLTYTEFQYKTKELLSNNKHVEFANYIINLNLDKNYLVVYLAFAYHFFCNNLSIDFSELLSQINPNSDVKFKIISELRNNNGILFEQELLEIFNSNSIFTFPEIAIGKKVQLLIDSKIKFSETQNHSSLFNTIKNENLQEAVLFYESNINKQIITLESLLKPEPFKNLQTKMISNNMKPGVTILLHGSPGTGKTETVYQLAKKSGRDILKVDASTIRSKWVGESEKNVKSIFNDYKETYKKNKEIPILLFNEADALLGKRKNVENSTDRHENSIQNIFLDELENFEGIFIATTNMTENLDDAFDRRFLYKIKFGCPDSNALLEIWKNKFPTLEVEILKNVCNKVILTAGQIENVRKKILIESLIHSELDINKELILKFSEDEVNLQKSKNFVRTPIGFIQ